MIYRSMAAQAVAHARIRALQVEAIETRRALEEVRSRLDRLEKPPAITMIAG